MLTRQQRRSIREWAIYLGISVPSVCVIGFMFWALLNWMGV